jgi:PKD repeat protein
MNKGIFAAGGALFAAILSVAAWGFDPPAAVAFVQPEYLSASTDSPLLLRASTSRGGRARLRVTVASSEGMVRLPVLERAITLEPGACAIGCVISASYLAPIALFEDVTIEATLETREGLLRDEVETTLLPEAAPPGPSAWGFSFASKPALVYTSRSTSLTFAVQNPKGSAQSVKIQLAFKNSTGQSPVTMSAKVIVIPGASTATVSVPSSITTQAKAKGATLLKATLKVQGVIKAKDSASLDYDLSASGSANPATGYLPLNVAFTGNAVGGQPPYTYRWDFGDGSGASLQSASHTFTAEGSFTARFTVTDSLGGSASSTTAIAVAAPPLVVTCTASPTSGSAPLFVSFASVVSGGVGSYAYDWNFGDGSPHAATANAAHTYTAAGSYTATLTITSGVHVKTCTQAVSVTGSTMTVTCTASPTSGVAPVTVAFGATASGGPSSYSYLWDFGDTATSTAQNPTHTYSNPGLYHAVVTVTSGGQTAQCQKDVSVTQLLAVDCTAAPTSGPAPLSVFFNVWAAGGIGLYTFNWTFGDGFTSTEIEPNHVYAAPGTYTATVTVKSGDQTKTCSQVITVN